jgi:membrane fusion protein, copper/silver efflux system
MSMVSPKKKWAIGGLVLLLLVLFRAPIWQWFAVGWTDGTSPHAEHESDDGFSSEDLLRLQAVFTAAEKVRFALSLDELAPIEPAAAEIQLGLASLDEADASETVQAGIVQASTAAAGLAAAETVVAARSLFGELSEALFQLALADPRLQTGWHVYTCPMAKSFQRWFQQPKEIENPYMGQEMLRCGSASDWGAAPEADAPSADEVAYYTCPMHPSVREQAPSACPICSMDLTPVTHGDLKTGEIQVDSVRRQRIGVRTEVVSMRPLTRSIRAVGQVAWDESKVVDVTARVDGWVEDLRVSRTGDPVAQYATLLRFYSPDLLATQSELLAAAPGGQLAQTARERLLLWGMSGRAIDSMLKSGKPQRRVAIMSPIGGVVVDKQVNSGAHVRSGALLFRIADTRQVWVEANVFEQDMAHVAQGQGVQVSLPHAPTEQLSGVIAYVYPTFDAAGRTGRVRIELSNEAGLLRPGMLANVDLEVTLGTHLAVPAEAVIYTGPRRLVFVDKGNGRLRPVEVKIGARAGDWVIVNSGLSEGDVVVSSGAFLLAAESRIRSATDHWEATDETQ